MYWCNASSFFENSALALFYIFCPHKIVLHVKGENSFWKGLRGLGIIPRESVHQRVTESQRRIAWAVEGKFMQSAVAGLKSSRPAYEQSVSGWLAHPPTPRVQLGSPVPPETLSQPTSADKMASSGERPYFFLSLGKTMSLSLGPRIFGAVGVTTILPLRRDSEQVTQSFLQPLQVWVGSFCKDHFASVPYQLWSNMKSSSWWGTRRTQRGTDTSLPPPPRTAESLLCSQPHCVHPGSLYRSSHPRTKQTPCVLGSAVSLPAPGSCGSKFKA